MSLLKSCILCNLQKKTFLIQFVKKKPKQNQSGYFKYNGRNSKPLKTLK